MRITGYMPLFDGIFNVMKLSRKNLSLFSPLLFFFGFESVLWSMDDPHNFIDDDFVDDDITAGFTFDNYSIQSGQASFSNLNGELQITASDEAVIKYGSGFDIPTGETVRFIQPSSQASVINNITNQIPTQIDGNLYGNGKVILLNDSGIVFGENAVVEVGKLHAIAGVDWLGSYFLSGNVENSGKLTAEEVVLAGVSVTNSGSIVSSSGVVVIAAGRSLQLFEQEQSLLVSLSEEFINPLNPSFSVSDVAGQALLQSGIVQASQLELHGNAIENTGSITSGSLKVDNFSTFSGNSGTISSSQLLITGEQETGTLEQSPSIDASGQGNQFGEVTLTGSINQLSLRSGSDLTVGESVSVDDPEPVDEHSVLSAQLIDLRVDNGDLTTNILFEPVDSTVDNSLLLAAENNLILATELDSYTHARKILYGRNLSAGEFAETELILGSTVSLDAISVFMDDLSPTLSAEVIQKLAVDNPSFEGFDSRGGLLELSSLSSEQLEMLFKYGLFTGYSYFLQAPTVEAVLENDLKEAGFSSTNAFFGGDFSILAGGGASASSGGDSGSPSSGGDGSDSGDGESEEGSSESAGSTPAEMAAARARRALGATPFTPVGRPILSPEAARILESALTPEIEAKLNQFIDQ